MAFRPHTLLVRSRRLAAGLAVAVGLGLGGAQALPFADVGPQPGFVPVHDHDDGHRGHGHRGYDRGHHHHRGHDRDWGGGHRGWDHDRGYGRRHWGHHHHHHHHDGRDRGYYRY